MIGEWLKPNWEPGLSLPNIPLDYLIAKGIKGLILDVDGTLLHREENKLHQSVVEWTQEAKELLSLHLVSNHPSKKRIGSIANELGVDYKFRAGKPRRKYMKVALDNFNMKSNEIAILGDRIFTDVLVGNRLGMFTVLVKPIDINGDNTFKNTLQRTEKFLANVFLSNKL